MESQPPLVTAIEVEVIIIVVLFLSVQILFFNWVVCFFLTDLDDVLKEISLWSFVTNFFPALLLILIIVSFFCKITFVFFMQEIYINYRKMENANKKERKQTSSIISQSRYLLLIFRVNSSLKLELRTYRFET